MVDEGILRAEHAISGETDAVGVVVVLEEAEAERAVQARRRRAAEAADGAGRVEELVVRRLHGRADALIPVNHNSRAYFAANKAAEGAASKLSYIEITNAIGAQLFYQGWADGGTLNGYRDKDFAGFAVSYTF